MQRLNLLHPSLRSPPPSLSVSPANGYISARASPGLLSVSNGNSLGKVVLAKSPPSPGPQMVNSRKPDLRVITSQSGKSLMQLVRRSQLQQPHRDKSKMTGSRDVTLPLTVHWTKLGGFSLCIVRRFPVAAHHAVHGLVSLQFYPSSEIMIYGISLMLTVLCHSTVLAVSTQH